MFVSTPNNQVMAFDASTSIVLWRYKRPRPEGAFVLHQSNRGVALYGNRVFFTAGEAVLIALDARTGREVWSTSVADNKAAYYTTLAPLVADGKVMIGASGGEFGVRGFVAAYDPDSGKQLWRTFTVPAPGEPGSETWPKSDQWKTGGAPVWVTGNYDSETNLAYWGTGNGGPWMGDRRPGDNLYVASTVAIDVATGQIKGHFQYNPNESWDWDEVSPPILVDYQRNGQTIKGLIDVARDGYLWFLERTTGPIKFVEGKPYVNQNVYRRLDPVTGRPGVDPARKPGTGKTAEFCPSAHGGKNWPPIAFSPVKNIAYGVGTEGCFTQNGATVAFRSKDGGIDTKASQPRQFSSDLYYGAVTAFDAVNHKVLAKAITDIEIRSSAIATAGGLVFTALQDGWVVACNDETLEELWRFNVGTPLKGAPVTYAIGPKQYLAVQAGGRHLHPVNWDKLQNSSYLFVFALN